MPAPDLRDGDERLGRAALGRWRATRRGPTARTSGSRACVRCCANGRRSGPRRRGERRRAARPRRSRAGRAPDAPGHAHRPGRRVIDRAADRPSPRADRPAGGASRGCASDRRSTTQRAGPERQADRRPRRAKMTAAAASTRSGGGDRRGRRRARRWRGRGRPAGWRRRRRAGRRPPTARSWSSRPRSTSTVSGRCVAERRHPTDREAGRGARLVPVRASDGVGADRRRPAGPGRRDWRRRRGPGRATRPRRRPATSRSARPRIRRRAPHRRRCACPPGSARPRSRCRPARAAAITRSTLGCIDRS